jgi:hypothetical protein
MKGYYMFFEEDVTKDFFLSRMRTEASSTVAGA